MEKKEYRIFDAHAHIFPRKIAQKASGSIGGFYGIPMRYDGTTGTLLEVGGRGGAAGYLVSSVATKAEQVTAINDFIARKCAMHDCFVGFGAMHEDFADFEAEIARIKALGLKGIKIHPDFQRFCIDGEATLPMFRAVAAAGLPVLFHMGDDRYDYSHPIRLVNLLERVPQLKVIASHFGGYRVWDCVGDCLAGADVYFDTSSSLPYISRRMAVGLIERFGYERFMFGTDYPMWDFTEELGRFLALGLDGCAEAAVLGGNFERLFLK